MSDENRDLAREAIEEAHGHLYGASEMIDDTWSSAQHAMFNLARAQVSANIAAAEALTRVAELLEGRP